MSHSRRTPVTAKLSSLFALALALSILCSVSLPVYSQSSADLREALTEEIRAGVERRLDIGDGVLSHEDIARLYLEDAEAAGLSYKELIQLYEQEYAEQKAAQQPGPWEQLVPNIGVIV